MTNNPQPSSTPRGKFMRAILVVAMALGTAWAVRGRFGHEQGAAWAGAIGALSLFLVCWRADWYNKVFRITMAAAFGWGISGVMSYGAIVGYGRGTDFGNVFYGLLMLFVLGLLYGFLGGGFFGLALADTRENKVKWPALLAEMIAIGLLTYAILINQLEWFMTPPRSEMWAACLGASIALGWYVVRNGHANVLRVAVFSALGAGFGFAFGNFLQVMGNVSGVGFNFWNVMEYAIGFFGGAGMAYGTLTASWPAQQETVQPQQNLLPLLFVTLFVPFVVWDQSFVSDRFDFVPQGANASGIMLSFKLVAIAGILLVAARMLYLNYSGRPEVSRGQVNAFFVSFFALYIFLSFLITGVWVHPVEQYLYVVNLVGILWLMPQTKGGVPEVYENKPVIWIRIFLIAVALIALLAVVAINSHEGMKGSQVRFGNSALER